MRIIALTGGIATGKSTVAGMLAGHGAAVVDADRIAREVVEPGTPGLEAVVAAFGRELLTAGGGLDRGALAEIVFADVESRRRLEAITHPLILARMAGEVAALAGSDAPLVVVDYPLLFEGGHQTEFPDGVLLAYADPATQIRRLRERGGLGDAAARQRLAAQLPIDGKRDLATWVIDNRGSRTDTRQAVDAWWRDQVATRDHVEARRHAAGRDHVAARDPDDPMTAPISDPTRPRDGGVG
ncbi:MAG: dephospho-CoA kinase [Candidatus Dormibacteria bacterium]|nr:dephospho-CoA kinase [Chloroflexota bacterium]HBV94966.1 dephospho-CoA kinase [Chloroflexota bacterium]